MNDYLDVGPPGEYVHVGLRAVNTCWACPEQYDVFYADGISRVGYLRLRHGKLTVEACPPGRESEGELVFEASPLGDGQFFDEERETYLNKALEAIDKWLGGGE